MTGELERRSSKRCDFLIPIDCAYFSSGGFHRVMTANHCQEGMYIESSVPFMPGATLFVRSENKGHICKCGNVRIAALAEVRWCEALSDSQETVFGLGIKFYPPPY